MTMRILLILLAVAIASVFGQIPSPVKAGDLAPNLSRTRILAGGDPETEQVREPPRWRQFHAAPLRLRNQPSYRHVGTAFPW